MTVVDAPSTRALRSSRSSSPTAESLVPTEPLTQQELSFVCTVARERLFVKPSVQVQASFRRKDDRNGARQTLMGKLRKEGLDLWGVWEDKPSKEYPFPHPDLDYFEINIIEDREVPSSVANSQVPISEPVGSSGELPSSAQEMAGGDRLRDPP